MNIAVILAGGKGVRMGTERPKQFLEIDGTPVIVTTAKIFEEHPGIDAIYIICLKEHCIFLRDLLKKYGFKKVKDILPGGETRQASSFIAVDYLYRLHAPGDIVLIHDAARPGVDSRIISENIAAAEKNGACNTVIPSQDTIPVSYTHLDVYKRQIIISACSAFPVIAYPFSVSMPAMISAST